MTENNVELKDALAPLTAKGVPLRERLAHLSWSTLVLDKTMELMPHITEAVLEEILDGPIAAKVAAELAGGGYPIANRNPGFAAGVLLGICIGNAAVPGVWAAAKGDEADEMAKTLCVALATKAQLARFNNDLVAYGLAA